jgi:hypothetical protein
VTTSLSCTFVAKIDYRQPSFEEAGDLSFGRMIPGYSPTLPLMST